MRRIVSVMVLGAAGCEADLPCDPPGPAPVSGLGGNVVVIVMDDVGVDKVGAYGVHPQPAATPTLDALSQRGVRFSQAYSQPVCSPGRAALLTGRGPRRNGVGNNVYTHRGGLSHAEVLIPEMLQDSPQGPWSSAAVGKWHLAAIDQGLTDPLAQGFDRFDGLLGNVEQVSVEDEGELDYEHWEHVVDGTPSRSNEYVVRAQTDAAITFVQTLPEPYLLYVAYSAAHGPYHVPPADLWSVADPVDTPGLGDAMIEAMDREIGRLLAAVDENTTTVFVTSDNGTSRHLVRPPSPAARAKATLYSGGTHVPMFVAGLAVSTPGVTRDALVSITDVFATVADLAGVDPADLGLTLDGRSLLPLLASDGPGHRCLVADGFPDGHPDDDPSRAIRDDRWLLVQRWDEPEELYATDRGVDDGPDLLQEHLEPEAREARKRLRGWLRAYDDE